LRGIKKAQTFAIRLSGLPQPPSHYGKVRARLHKPLVMDYCSFSFSLWKFERRIEQIKPYSLSRNTATKLQKFRVSENKIKFFLSNERNLSKIYQKNVRITNDSDKIFILLAAKFSQLIVE
ncbi:MAG: hypothetical protein IK067_03175, partial [Prevotella sp.]|nr:hypothetical protein [Prevotella sp.]